MRATEKEKAINGLKEVVDGCVCYCTTVGHEHLFNYRKHATEAYATSDVSLEKHHRCSKEVKQLLGQLHDPCLVSMTMRQSGKHLLLTVTPTKD